MAAPDRRADAADLGRGDRLVPPSFGEAYRALIPDSRLVVLPDAGHAPFDEQKDAFLAAFREHVGRCLQRVARLVSAHRYATCPARRSACPESKTMAAVSPLAPERFPTLAPIAGVRLAAHAAGIRYTRAHRSDGRRTGAGQHGGRGVDDVSDPRASGRVVPAEPDRRPSAGNRRQFRQSNVFTGRAGWQVVQATAAEAARLFGRTQARYSFPRPG